VHVKTRIGRRAQKVPEMKNTIDSVYVLYILSTGLVDDLAECVATLEQ